MHWRSGVYASCRIWCPWNLQLADNAWIGWNVDCYNVAMVTLGKNVTVSQGCHLCTASHDITDMRFPLIAGPISIGEAGGSPHGLLSVRT
jgi:putative colanic acid biosynthesis acetyltransferase WcaF